MYSADSKMLRNPEYAATLILPGRHPERSEGSFSRRCYEKILHFVQDDGGGVQDDEEAAAKG